MRRMSQPSGVVCALIRRCAPCVRRESQAERKQKGNTEPGFSHRCRTVPFHALPPFFPLPLVTRGTSRWACSLVGPTEFLLVAWRCGPFPPSHTHHHHEQSRESSARSYWMGGDDAGALGVGDRGCSDVASFLCNVSNFSRLLPWPGKHGGDVVFRESRAPHH